MTGKTHQGFSIIELIVALSIGLFLLVPIINTLDLIESVPGMNASRLEAEKEAQEAIEAVNLIKNRVFACRCSVDSCSGQLCTRTSDSAVCSLPENYTSCWTDYPDNNVGVNDYRLIQNGSDWDLAAMPGAVEIIRTQPYLSRQITIENARRNIGGVLAESGQIDPASKFINVVVEYENRGRRQSIRQRLLVTAWENL